MQGDREARLARRPDPLWITLAATMVVVALSYLLPDEYAATGVGLAFLLFTYALVLRNDVASIRTHGLSLGGLLEPGPITPRRLVGEAARAAGWASAAACVTFPLFWLGFRLYWGIRSPLFFRPPASWGDEVLGQWLVIALPEEAFYRGYLQTELDAKWGARWRIAGASLGPGWLVTSALFAAGHVLTEPHPGRLAVFFPSLVFGYLRARSGGVGSSATFHAACNVFSAFLARGYGFARHS